MRCCDILHWMRRRTLVLWLIVGLMFGAITCKTVSGPCDGENCPLGESPDHQHQPVVEPVIEMVQQVPGQEPRNDGASEKDEEEAVVNRDHSIDPETMLHPAGGDHVHQVVNTDTVHDSGAAGPDVARELHGGLSDAKVDGSSVEGTQTVEEQGPDVDAVLHGGDRHAHSKEETGNREDAEGAFGVDPEGMLHDGVDAHGHHAQGKKEEGRVAEEPRDYATDIDAMLHGGDKHAHSHNATRREEDETPPEVPIGATDPEALLHPGQDHVHSQARAPERNDQEARPYGAQDPDSMLHGSDGVHSHTVQQAIHGSRPLAGPKDPDEVAVDANPEDIRTGTLRPQDAKDYHEWKTEKLQQQADGTKESSSWLSGFSYVTDAIFRDLEAVKKRYLAKLWSEQEPRKTKGKEEEEEKADGKTVRTTHDEA